MGKKLDEPYTRISNRIIESLYKMKLSGSELSVVLFIIRNTYGYQEKLKELSISYISNGTNLHKQTVANAIRKLSKMNILECGEGSYTLSRKLGINKNTRDWKLGRCKSNDLQYENDLQYADRLTKCKSNDLQGCKRNDLPIKENIKEKYKENTSTGVEGEEWYKKFE